MTTYARQEFPTLSVSGEGDFLGTPTDGTFADGLLDFEPRTKKVDAIDDINELLLDLAPADAGTLSGKDLTIKSGVAKVTGYLAASGTSTYKPGNAAGVSVNYIVKPAGSFVLETPSTTDCCNHGDIGLVKVYINNALKDTFDLTAHFDEAERNGSQTYPPTLSPNSYLRVTSVAKYNGLRKWQKFIAELNIAKTDLIEGWNTVKLVHDDPTMAYQSSNMLDFYYDIDSGANPSVSGVTLTSVAPTSSKYLSGVRFYSTGDTLMAGATGANCFNNVYAQYPLVASGLIGVSPVNIATGDVNISGVSNPPFVGQTLTLTNKPLTFTIVNVCTVNARLSFTPADPYGTYTPAQTAAQGILVSTFADGMSGQSNNTNEYFSNEYYRLALTHDVSSTSNAITGTWISQNLLSVGDAQCYVLSENVHGLKYPTADFRSGYSPTQTANYAGFSGDQKFLRAFVASSGKTNVNLVFYGLGGGIGMVGAGDVNVEIKLPDQTGWLDCAKAYNSVQGVATDGCGCLNGSITYNGGNASFSSTFGGKSTNDTNGRMYMRITLRNTNRTISRVSCANW